MKARHDIALDFSRQVKKILGNNLSKVILYGSYARGDYTSNSDMDIMILTTLSDREIEQTENSIFDLVFDFQIEHSIDISVVIKMKINSIIGLEHYHFMIMSKRKESF